jgi:hypothetical protein
MPTELAHGPGNILHSLAGLCFDRGLAEGLAIGLSRDAQAAGLPDSYPGGDDQADSATQSHVAERPERGTVSDFQEFVWSLHVESVAARRFGMTTPKCVIPTHGRLHIHAGWSWGFSATSR